MSSNPRLSASETPSIYEVKPGLTKTPSLQSPGGYAPPGGEWDECGDLLALPRCLRRHGADAGSSQFPLAVVVGVQLVGDAAELR